MEWEDLPATIDAWTDAVSEPAERIKQSVAVLFGDGDVGFYCHPDTKQVALYAPHIDLQRQEQCKRAADSAVGPANVRDLFLSYQELSNPDCKWVKVAYSPTLRRVGELLNFFPGQYPGGIPNFPSPAAAMLTSGLVGAGLGYGGGKLLAKTLPEGYGDRLGRTGAVVGGLAGAGLGGMWGGVNLANNRSLLDPWPLNTPPDAQPEPEPENWLEPNEASSARDPVDAYIRQLTPGVLRLKRAWEIVEDMPLVPYYEKLCKVAGDLFGYAPPNLGPTPLDVNINSMGQTLWQLGASPQLTGMTMGSLYAAQQMPDPSSRPGWATGSQLAQLAGNATGNYVNGAIVGAALNKLVGTPFAASRYGMGAVALGIIGAVVPKLFSAR